MRRARSSDRSFVLVVVAPPAVGRRLRTTLGRVLPLLLAAQRREVEEGPDRTGRPDRAGGALELVLRGLLDHRKPAPLGRERVAPPRRLLLLDEELVPCGPPLLL